MIYALIFLNIVVLGSAIFTLFSVFNFCRDESNKTHKILIRYHDSKLEKVKTIAQGDLIDLRADEDVDLKPMDHKLISLGVSMKLPDGYYAILAPRSSTYKKYGIICANSIGFIDNSYSGDDDIWKFSAIALRETHISKGDRICQFTIVKKEKVKFKEVSKLEGANRSGFGSTGTK